MGSPVIVEGEEAGELEGALGGGGIGASVGPAAKQCLDEFLSLSIGAGTIGARAQMTEAELSASRGKAVGAVAVAVVGHDARDRHAVGEIPEDQSSEEGRGGGRSFVGEDFGVSQAGSVINGDVDELPAGSAA